MLTGTHEDLMQKLSQWEICQHECHPGFKANQQRFQQGYWSISATPWLFLPPVEPRASPKYSSWISRQPWAWFGTPDTHAVYWHILICTPILKWSTLILWDKGVLYVHTLQKEWPHFVIKGSVSLHMQMGQSYFSRISSTLILIFWLTCLTSFGCYIISTIFTFSISLKFHKIY